METKDFQKLAAEFVKKWEIKRGVNPARDDVFMHFVEESGELARQLVNFKERKDKYSQEEVEDSLGDLMMQLFRLADLEGLDMEKTVQRIIERETPLLS